MKFGDYLGILKKGFASSISNQDLCMLLFDSIIEPLDLRNQDGEILDYSKGRISEFIKDKKPIPQAIRDGYNNKIVGETIADYFEERIVSELIPDTSDLCYQLMALIDDDTSISPTSKANLRMLATAKTVSLFLAQSFGYALRNDDPELLSKPSIEINDNAPSSPKLSIAGMIDGGTCEGLFSTETFELMNKESKDALIEKIRYLFNKVSSISLSSSSVKSGGFSYYLGSEKVELDQEYIDSMKMVAESLSIVLPDDFFSLGNLRNNQFKSSMSLYGGLSLEGADSEKAKYRAIKELEKAIDEVFCLISIDNQFKTYKSIKVAVTNNGTLADQNVSVSITIPKASFVTIDELLRIDHQVLEDVLYNRSSDRIFYIERTASVLDYEESIRNRRIHPIPASHLIPSFMEHRDKTEDYRRELEDIFPYFVTVEGEHLTITVEFDEVLHNTNVAFPSVILLNDNIECLEYSIRSRNLPDIVTGVLHHK